MATYAVGGVRSGLVGAAFVIVITLVLKAGTDCVGARSTWIVITVPVLGLLLAMVVSHAIGRSEATQERTPEATPPRSWRRWITFAIATCALLSGEQPSKATPTAPLAAWDKDDGFRIQTPDGYWRLRVGVQLAVIYQPLFEASGNDWANFGLTYARPYVSGSLLRPWLQYWCSFEFRTYPPFLLDCYADGKPLSFFGVRAGQFSTPQSRHENRGPRGILFPDFATVADYFWTGRDRGVQLYGETRYVDYYASFTAGTTLTQTISPPGNFQLIGRVSLNPLGAMQATEMPYVTEDGPVPFRFSIGLQGAWGRVNPNGIGFNPDAFLQQTQQGERDQAIGGADLLVQWGRFGFFGEFYGRHLAPRDMLTPSFEQYGAWAQAHVTFFRRILDLGARFDWINPSTNLANDRFLAGEAQLAWFIFGPTLALRLRYGVANQQNPGPAPAGNPGLLTTVGLPTSPGTEHLASLQLQLTL